MEDQLCRRRIGTRPAYPRTRRQHAGRETGELEEAPSELPDASIEQNFARDETGDKTRRFTIRTTEKEPELVKATINRLFVKNNESLLVKSTFNYEQQGKVWDLNFVDSEKKNPTYASPSYIKLLLDREFRTAVETEEPLVEYFRLDGIDDPKDGRHAKCS